MIPQETVDRILDLAQIEDVVGDFVTLKRAGATYKACCPFHNEKTPSFVVSPSKGIYKCFGCGKSGTAVGFVMEHESMTYVEALKYLARKYNVEIIETEESAEEIAKRQRSESLLLVSEYAGKFFQDSLMKTQEGQTIGYQYFRSRGLEDATIKKYGLGWAPVDRNTFTSVARAAGYKEEYLLDTGLCKQFDDGRVVDTFYDRVMFPVHSVSGRIIAFGGRTLKTDKTIPKYVNSKETEIYVKSKSLYGIYFAKNEISRQDKCILVEGYLDVLSMHQLGITNVVASSGTSLTVEQIRLIRKFSNNVTIIYDGDGAGIKAALRGIDLVLKEGLNVKVVLLPDGQDPDDFARRHTLEEVQDHIKAHEQDFINFKTDLLLGEAGNDPLKRANLINDIADTIALMPDAVVRAVYIRTSADRFEIDESILADRISRTRAAMIEAEQKQRQREWQKAQNQAQAQYPGAMQMGDVPPPPPMDDYIPEEFEPMPPIPVIEQTMPTGPVIINEPYLEPCEKELLGFVLEEGCSPLEFDRDSRYYVEGAVSNVADFIDGTLADDGIDFLNTSYAKTYEAFFELYGEGLSQLQIQQRLLNSMDEEIAAVAKEILIEKYQITVKNYEQSMTSVSSRLVMFVPKSLMAYQCKRVELDLKHLMKELETADMERQMEILAKITELNKIRTMLKNELGRV
ncbi:MAG: DNA primase [Bacteroidales bacterium]|nr:DNA primase [Bacteroidales bacterium]